MQLNEQPLDREVTMETATTVARDHHYTLSPASPGQIQLISDMAKERGVDVAAIFRRPANWKEARTIIEWLKARPITDKECPFCGHPKGQLAHACRLGAKPSPTAPVQYDGLAPAPKDGKKARAWHYALRTEAGEVKFYRVKRGYKPGFYFVDAQASDEYYPIRNRAQREAILTAIAKDPQAALALYGQELGRCGRCGITLTSEYRKLGIGPVCINK